MNVEKNGLIEDSITDSILSSFCTDFSFGWRLKHIRLRRHKTQLELGLACGFPENAAGMRIRQYESNKRHPKNNVLKKMASDLQISQLMLSMNTTDIQTLLFSTFLWANICGIANVFPATKNDPLYEENVLYPFNTVIDANVPGIVPQSEDKLFVWLNEYNKVKKQLLQKEITEEEFRNWRYLWQPHN